MNCFGNTRVKISVYTTKPGKSPSTTNPMPLSSEMEAIQTVWEPLDGLLKDVRDVATALEKHGFTVTLKTNLKKPDFDTAFETFIRKGAGKDNRLLFYYAGAHGHTEIDKQTGKESGYLVNGRLPYADWQSAKLTGTKT